MNDMHRAYSEHRRFRQERPFPLEWFNRFPLDRVVRHFIIPAIDEKLAATAANDDAGQSALSEGGA